MYSDTSLPFFNLTSHHIIPRTWRGHCVQAAYAPSLSLRYGLAKLYSHFVPSRTEKQFFYCGGAKTHFTLWENFRYKNTTKKNTKAAPIKISVAGVDRVTSTRAPASKLMIVTAPLTIRLAIHAPRFPFQRLTPVTISNIPTAKPKTIAPIRTGTKIIKMPDAAAGSPKDASEESTARANPTRPAAPASIQKRATPFTSNGTVCF